MAKLIFGEIHHGVVPLHKRPKVLVMDEATSALDVTPERAVNEAISALNISRVIIALRPEIIASAERLIALNSGQVVHDAPSRPQRMPHRPR